MMIVMSGYSMSYEVAKAWALRRWPEIEFSPQDGFIPITIQPYHRMIYPDRQEQQVVAIIRRGKSYCVFARRYVDDPAATAISFKRIRETDEDKKFVLECFPREVAAKQVSYMTISDPYEVHNTYLGKSVIRVHTIKLQ
jgi:hypothetical protein